MPLGHSHISTMLCWKSWLLSACHIVIVLIQLLIKEAGLCIVWYKCTHAMNELAICACSVRGLAWLWLHRSFTMPMKWWCVMLVPWQATFVRWVESARHPLVHVYTYSHSRGAVLVLCWYGAGPVSGVSMSSICSLHNKVAVNSLHHVIHMHSKSLMV